MQSNSAHERAMSNCRGRHFIWEIHFTDIVGHPCPSIFLSRDLGCQYVSFSFAEVLHEVSDRFPSGSVWKSWFHRSWMFRNISATPSQTWLIIWFILYFVCHLHAYIYFEQKLLRMGVFTWLSLMITNALDKTMEPCSSAGACRCHRDMCSLIDPLS